jgi:alpha-tubulin suppressor-like RCC1 family protein
MRAHGYTPRRIGDENDWLSISAGGYHTIALKKDRSMWLCGRNKDGQLGNGTLDNRPIFKRPGIEVSGDDTLEAAGAPVRYSGNDGNWVKIAGSDRQTVALKADGTLWACGGNTDGQLGNGTRIDSLTLIQIGRDSDWADISACVSHTMALKKDGSLWVWGSNELGQIGNGTKNDAIVPCQVGKEKVWVAVSACGGHSTALKMDGSLWVWGRNTNGQLGDGTQENRLSPIPVGLPKTKNKKESVGMGSRYY